MVVLVAWFGLALNAYRLKTLIVDLQQRVLLLSNRNANQASQAKRYPKLEDIEDLAQIRQPRKRYSNDPMDIEHLSG